MKRVRWDWVPSRPSLAALSREIRAADDIGCGLASGAFMPSFNSHQARVLEILPGDECGVVGCREI